MDISDDRVNATMESIRKFKRESEAAILGSNPTLSARLGKNAAVLSPYSHVSGAQYGSMLGKILNTDCIIMPFSKEKNAHQKLWPHALVANRASTCGEIGPLESHGSLWRLVPFMEGETTRIVLQCAERGELPMYLAPDLNLVEMKVDAALWRPRLSDTSLRPNNQAGSGEGVLVLLELLGADGKVAPAGAETPVLACETSKELRAYSELFVEPVPLRLGPGGDSGPVGVAEVGDSCAEQAAHPAYRSCQWEVVPEAWLDAQQDGLEFLEGFIH